MRSVLAFFTVIVSFVAAELHQQQREERATSIIWPGTKWCGVGNIAQGYNDLGKHAEADKCCRAHDNCGNFIPSFKSKHGVFNFTPFPMQMCSCDYDFRRCLLENDDDTSDAVGIFFFEKLNVKCYEDSKVKDLDYN